MTGGLDTLEAIGKKTMEVLQDGDPGLKKKRAFFMNEIEKPNLSQILREAKEKAETEEKTIEERELARKVHFESLFDDYQGLVHLEALEMLSKQSNMKIQQHLIELNANDLTSVQETLEEIKELCDLGDDEDDEEKDNKDFKNRLENACHDLGVDITYEKLYSVRKYPHYIKEVLVLLLKFVKTISMLSGLDRNGKLSGVIFNGYGSDLSKCYIDVGTVHSLFRREIS